MNPDRRQAAVWAGGMGLLAAAVGGSVVSASSPARELQHVAGFALVFVPALYALLVRRWDVWSRTHPLPRFFAFFVGTFVAMVVLGLAVRLLVGGLGVVTAVLEFLAAVAGFGVGVWLILYGGGERLWHRLVPLLGLEW